MNGDRCTKICGWRGGWWTWWTGVVDRIFVDRIHGDGIRVVDGSLGDGIRAGDGSVGAPFVGLDCQTRVREVRHWWAGVEDDRAPFVD